MTKKPDKKPDEKEPKKSKLTSEERFVTEPQMREIERLDAAARLDMKNVLIMRSRLALLQEQQKSLGFQISLTNQEIKELENKNETRLETARKFRQDIAKSFNIDGKWGYHPDTGKVLMPGETS